jgi:redox-sensitive bicupin YhaK (pirin superfamily)
MEEDTDVILIPVVGTVAFEDSAGNETLVEAGEVQVMHLKTGAPVQLKIRISMIL